MASKRQTRQHARAEEDCRGGLIRAGAEARTTPRRHFGCRPPLACSAQVDSHSIRIDRPAFSVIALESWVEVHGATNQTAGLVRLGEQWASCVVMLVVPSSGPGYAQLVEETFVDDNYLNFFAIKLIAGDGKFISVRRSEIKGKPAVEAVSERDGERILHGMVMKHGNIYTASCRTAVADYEGLEPEFRAIINSLDVKS